MDGTVEDPAGPASCVADVRLVPLAALGAAGGFASALSRVLQSAGGSRRVPVAAFNASL